MSNPSIAARTILATVLFTSAACSAGTAATPGSSDAGGLVLEDCILSSEGSVEQVDARCGLLEVPEDRASPDGRHINLHVAVIPAELSDSEPDPVFLLAGGPGQAASEAFPGAMFAFEDMNERRDIVLLDQRGTGKSSPLECDLPDETEGEPDEETLLLWARGCAETLEEEADLRLYTTAIASADLDDVRRALGYQQINLYGGSYGSRAALDYLRRYEDHVRTVIIDSVVPPDLALGTTVARDAQNALDLTFARCAADEVCRAAFPRLEDDFRALMAELEREPKELVVDHPVTGLPTELTLRKGSVAGALRFWSYSPETASLLPLLITETVASGDYGRMAQQLLLVGDASANLINLGLHFSVVCSEDVPFFDPDDVALHNADTYLADVMTDRLTRICEVWPRGVVPDDLKSPVASDVPVLILSGEADPVTPPAYGDAVASTLGRSLHLVAPEQGHGVLMRGCVAELAAEFVASGSVDGLDTECVKELAAPPFFVSFLGPVPEPPTREAQDD